ncbi:MAG TPA: exopolyphosphatase [Desulfobacteraceae bacterium]|nr:exopolyphosphatase [Desulfobacteraceae bacterium]
MTESNKPLIIANCSGFLGDRLSAVRQMVEGGPIDVLTGDYLAELTMALLFRMKMKDPQKGYAVPFLKQMEAVMGPCLDRGIKVVANAGGLNPLGLVKALEDVAGELGLHPRLAAVTGDDLLPELSEYQAEGEIFTHLDSGEPLAGAQGGPITANAYLGGWGITRALSQGADIVVGGRIADAALVSGPCAWHFNWQPDDWDRLAGAYAAGHIIECGTQATGGNYSFMEEIPSFKHIGFPIAEMHGDGSFVITKHPGTGGRVSRGTVTAQLLYEIQSPAYKTPDVTALFDTLSVADIGDDRVLVTGAKGAPPPDTTKVCINTLWGHKNTMTVVLTGLDIEKKAAIVEEILFDSLGGRENFAQSDVQLIRSDRENPDHNDLAFAMLRISVMDPDAKKAGKLFSAKVVELALASVPGFTLTGPPSGGTPAIRHWPTLVDSRRITQVVHMNGETVDVPQLPEIVRAAAGQTSEPHVDGCDAPSFDTDGIDTRKIPLGRLFATRSGDKGGNANLGVWAKAESAYPFLRSWLTTDRLKALLPDLKGFDIERYELPNLLAVNFYIRGLLGHGVAASMRSDPQAKTLGEYLRAKVVAVPVSIL